MQLDSIGYLYGVEDLFKIIHTQRQNIVSNCRSRVKCIDESVFSLWWQQRGECSSSIHGIQAAERVCVCACVGVCPPVKGHPLPAHIITAC